METLLLALRVYVIFIAASGFVLGQIFFGNFAWDATLVGVFGIISGVFSGEFTQKTLLRAKIIIACCLLSLCGVSLDIYDYYANYNVPGSRYSWFLITPFCLALVFIIWHTAKNMSPKKGL